MTERRSVRAMPRRSSLTARGMARSLRAAAVSSGQPNPSHKREAAVGPVARREQGDHRLYSTDEQRRATGCDGGRMPARL
jgi:hypothetical protein